MEPPAWVDRYIYIYIYIRAGNVGYTPDGYCVVLSTKCGKNRRHIHTTREDSLTYGMASDLPKGLQGSQRYGQ